jgi:hypothetical protein
MTSVVKQDLTTARGRWNRFCESWAAGVTVVVLWCGGLLFFLAEITALV